LAKVFFHRDVVNNELMACVAFGAWEGVNVLVVILTFFARHLQVSPDWVGEVGKFIGEFFLA